MAAGLAPASAQIIDRQGPETAAIPQFAPSEPNGLPRVISAQDERLYREIFRVQEIGDWKTADRLIARLTDRRLMGHVLYQRYMHPTAYHSSFKELKSWMAVYADQPGADRVYALALKRMPAGATPPRKPEKVRKAHLASLGEPVYVYHSDRQRSSAQVHLVDRLKTQVRQEVRHSRLSAAEELLRGGEAKRLLDRVEIDQGLAEVANGWFHYGNARQAYRLAAAATKRSGDYLPKAHWTAGLSAWVNGKLEAAARHFRAVADSERALSWDRAAGAYWAARAELKLGNPGMVSVLLVQAAQERRTFYGQLARQALGLIDDDGPTRVDAKAYAHLLHEPRLARAAALIQVGESELAQQELVRAGGWDQPEHAEALLILAERAQLPSFTMRLANRLTHDDSLEIRPEVADAMLFPLPPWEPESGFQVDRALLYALMRQESGFNAEAESGQGAMGLMQLLPSTAHYVAQDGELPRGKEQRLFNPGFNMELAQRYVQRLMQDTDAGEDLFKLAAAYNGGPGNLRRWQKRLEDVGYPAQDPLLFIEALPSRETRLFIERVLTNLWMYRKRLGQPAPSLKALAQGDWPRYESLDSHSRYDYLDSASLD
ncbi:lytic transglycosylase domain-containing protein [Tistlia consotensis]|uniref:lytic transglycosylase domain-containing protein n=1 Tax=Tistlia consotensis TaxID=1321365 RepID=UPI000A147AB3|nr:lytic transglycosylase domain-containing protein [Tistlia consotensis]